MVKGGITYRILSDQVGSVRLVVDATTGAVVQRIDYDAFGVVTQDTNPGFQPFGFAGGLMDLDTGLVRFGARDYDPSVGRWTSKDPVRFRGRTLTLYDYAQYDPVNLVDPNGWVWFATGGGLSGGGGLGKGASQGSYLDFSSGNYGSYTAYGHGVSTPGATATQDFSFGTGPDPGGQSYYSSVSYGSSIGLACQATLRSGDAGWSVEVSLGVGWPPSWGVSGGVSDASATMEGNAFNDVMRALRGWTDPRSWMPR